jgi:enoyl-CoA hydratase
MNESITTERRGRVFLIGLNRVAKRNAFDPPMFHALARAYGEYERDPELWCAVVFAHGDHFSGGIDLAQYSERFQQPDAFPMGEGEVDPFGMRSRLTKPLVITAHGIAYTIAVEMMLAADIRIAASDVRFAQLEIGRGLYPLGGAPFRLVREAGWGNAMRWLLTGEEFGAQEALRLRSGRAIEPGAGACRAHRGAGADGCSGDTEIGSHRPGAGRIASNRAHARRHARDSEVRGLRRRRRELPGASQGEVRRKVNQLRASRRIRIP